MGEGRTFPRPRWGSLLGHSGAQRVKRAIALDVCLCWGTVMTGSLPLSSLRCWKVSCELLGEGGAYRCWVLPGAPGLVT